MIDLYVDGNVAEIALNNPRKLNALSEEDLDFLDEALANAETRGVGALILRGEGRAFCAGRDIGQVDPTTDEAERYLADLVTPLLRRLADFPAPTYGIAHGACLGVGLGMLIACDVVYVAGGASIGSPFGNIGALLDSGGHALFFERLGAHRALDLAYSGAMMTGEEAVRCGLFSRSMPDAEVLTFTRAMARKVAAGPTEAFVASKRVIAELRDKRLGLWEAMDAEAKSQGALSETANYREGFTAFKEKRPPVFV
jgi:enoyl-CoA hydratase/carnithine racemase